MGGRQKTTIAVSYYYSPSPAFSPSGKKIVFVKRQPETGRFFDTDIYTVNVDGGGLKRLTNDPTAQHSPSYSPDGTKIVFSRILVDDSEEGIWTMNADGSNKKRLTTAPTFGADLDPDWSPDGTEINFERRDSDGGANIYAVRPDGTGLRNITRTPNIGEYEPVYPPDGNRIAYLHTNDRRGSDIWKVPSTGGNGGPVTSTPDVYEDVPSWGPLP